MNQKRFGTLVRLGAVPALLFASSAIAGQTVGVTAGAVVGTPVGVVVSAVLGSTVGTALPIGLGGAAAITGLGLIVGVQLIRRRGRK